MHYSWGNLSLPIGKPFFSKLVELQKLGKVAKTEPQLAKSWNLRNRSLAVGNQSIRICLSTRVQNYASLSRYQAETACERARAGDERGQVLEELCDYLGGQAAEQSKLRGLLRQHARLLPSDWQYQGDPVQQQHRQGTARFLTLL